jgi:hypothetical protein
MSTFIVPDTERITYLLLCRGYDLDKISKIRHMKVHTLLGHLYNLSSRDFDHGLGAFKLAPNFKLSPSVKFSRNNGKRSCMNPTFYRSYDDYLDKIISDYNNSSDKDESKNNELKNNETKTSKIVKGKVTKNVVGKVAKAPITCNLVSSKDMNKYPSLNDLPPIPQSLKGEPLKGISKDDLLNKLAQQDTDKSKLNKTSDDSEKMNSVKAYISKEIFNRTDYDNSSDSEENDE